MVYRIPNTTSIEETEQIENTHYNDEERLCQEKYVLNQQVMKFLEIENCCLRNKQHLQPNDFKYKKGTLKNCIGAAIPGFRIVTAGVDVFKMPKKMPV